MCLRFSHDSNCITLAATGVVCWGRDSAISLLGAVVAGNISHVPHLSLLHHHSSNIC